MVTVLDALQAGKTYLAIRCEPCRVLRHVWWKNFPQLRLGDRLDELPGRLRCEKCGHRPSSVEAGAQSDAFGYAKKIY
ncbi:hypothetical protein [Bosea sp. TAF32]|uniref:hypothetical protein n=1 Tax=Bosea sp. TAF32 TaxID=3237482 RepID=UPI003F937518